MLCFVLFGLLGSFQTSYKLQGFTRLRLSKFLGFGGFLFLGCAFRLPP